MPRELLNFCTAMKPQPGAAVRCYEGDEGDYGPEPAG